MATKRMPKLSEKTQDLVRGHVAITVAAGERNEKLRAAIEELLFRAVLYDRGGEGEPLTELAAAANEFARLFYVEHDPETMPGTERD